MKIILISLLLGACVRSDKYVEYDFTFNYPNSGVWICDYRDYDQYSDEFTRYMQCTHTVSKIHSPWLQVPISVPVGKFKRDITNKVNK